MRKKNFVLSLMLLPALIVTAQNWQNLIQVLPITSIRFIFSTGRMAGQPVITGNLFILPMGAITGFRGIRELRNLLNQFMRLVPAIFGHAEPAEQL